MQHWGEPLLLSECCTKSCAADFHFLCTHVPLPPTCPLHPTSHLPCTPVSPTRFNCAHFELSTGANPCFHQNVAQQVALAILQRAHHPSLLVQVLGCADSGSGSISTRGEPVMLPDTCLHNPQFLERVLSKTRSKFLKELNQSAIIVDLKFFCSKVVLALAMRIMHLMHHPLQCQVSQ
jgi:hypothetical protein